MNLGLAVLAALNLLASFCFTFSALAQFGAGPSADSFFASTILPQLISAVILSPLGNVLLPHLAIVDDATRKGRAWSVVGTFLTWMALGTLLLLASSAGWVPLLVPGFSPEHLETTLTLSRIQLLQILAMPFQTVATAYLQSARRFARIHGAGLVSWVAALMTLPWAIRNFGLAGAVWTMVFRILLETGLLSICLGFPGFLREAGFVSMLFRQLWAPIAGSAYYKLNFAVDRVFASIAPAGSLSLYHLSERLYGAGIDITRAAMITPSLSDLAIHSRNGEWESFTKNCRLQATKILWFTGTVYVCLLLFGYPLLQLILSRSVFTPGDTDRLWVLLALMGGYLVAGSLGVLLAQAFFAKGATTTPARVGAVGFTLGVAAKAIGFNSAGISGLAVASSLHQAFNAILLFILLRRQIVRSGLEGVSKEPPA